MSFWIQIWKWQVVAVQTVVHRAIKPLLGLERRLALVLGWRPIDSNIVSDSVMFVDLSSGHKNTGPSRVGQGM